MWGCYRLMLTPHAPHAKRGRYLHEDMYEYLGSAGDLLYSTNHTWKVGTVYSMLTKKWPSICPPRVPTIEYNSPPRVPTYPIIAFIHIQETFRALKVLTHSELFLTVQLAVAPFLGPKHCEKHTIQNAPRSTPSCGPPHPPP